MRCEQFVTLHTQEAHHYIYQSLCDIYKTHTMACEIESFLLIDQRAKGNVVVCNLTRCLIYYYTYNTPWLLLLCLGNKNIQFIVMSVLMANIIFDQHATLLLYVAKRMDTFVICWRRLQLKMI